MEAHYYLNYLDQLFVNGHSVKIRAMKVGKHTVRLGFEAPKELSVHRSEVFDKLQNESEEGV